MTAWMLAHWWLIWLCVGLVAAAYAVPEPTRYDGMDRVERVVRQASRLAGVAVFIAAGPVGLVALLLHAVEDRI